MSEKSARQMWEDRIKTKPSKSDGGLGHDELRDRWMERYPHHVRSGDDWWAYRAGFWEREDDGVIESQVIDVLEGSRDEGVKVTGHLMGSVLKLARATTYTKRDIWDANPGILVCQNGTLEIEKRILRDHSPEDYATGALTYDYEPTATADVFLAVLNQVVPDAVLFLQEFAGYCLTTDTSLETALWLKGPQGSGKSTVIEGFQAMLGPRAGTLGLAEIENSSFALEGIPGKTLLTSTEQPASFLKSTHVIDALISGEPLNIDRKYKAAERYRPIAKIMWAMNEAPRIASAQGGIFRRVHILPFPALKGERDPQIKELIKTEGAGILNWALEGLTRLSERGGFEFPEKMRSATAEWEFSNDLPAQFVDEECFVGPEHETASGYLYERYRDWAKNAGHTPLSKSRMKEEWQRLGFVYKPTNTNRMWQGVRLKSTLGGDSQ